MFYIRASNADAISLSPARAEYEYYIYGNVTGVDEFELTTTVTAPQWTIAPNPATESFSLRNCAAFSRSHHPGFPGPRGSGRHLGWPPHRRQSVGQWCLPHPSGRIWKFSHAEADGSLKKHSNLHESYSIKEPG